MDTTDILNREFSKQDFAGEQPYAELLDRYRETACAYARLENAIAVLSDMKSNVSYIYYGGFSRMLQMDGIGKEGKLFSIWEKDIFKFIHPDDLAGKHLHELCFFHFIKRQPKKKRVDYYLASKLRMRGKSDAYIPVLHRMFYVSVPFSDALWLALCLYSPLSVDIPGRCMVVNSVNGQMLELEKQDNTKILSAREKQVLNLIDKGLASKDIAGILAISINTVSRHRQEILGKLQVRNSIEACRIAKDLNLI